jgi:hypothetical protein
VVQKYPKLVKLRTLKKIAGETILHTRDPDCDDWKFIRSSVGQNISGEGKSGFSRWQWLIVRDLGDTSVCVECSCFTWGWLSFFSPIKSAKLAGETMIRTVKYPLQFSASIYQNLKSWRGEWIVSNGIRQILRLKFRKPGVCFIKKS